VDIEVDGGVSAATISEIAEAGANVLVAGSAIYGSNDYQETIASLKKLAKSGAARYR
jgi:ribulose-phosphate 3-epimerase